MLWERSHKIRNKLKDKIINDIWRLFETKKEEEDKKKANVKWKKVIRDKIIRYIKTLLEQEEDYYKPERVRNSWKNNYIEYESNGNKNRNLSLDKDLPKIKPHFRNIIINLQSSEAWKIQLTIAINFISSKDVGEEFVMHSNSGNIKLTSDSDQMMLVINSLSQIAQYIKKS